MRANHPSKHTLKMKSAFYLRPLGHHLPSSLGLSGAASLHSAGPEVTPAHDSRHTDSLTAGEKTLSLLEIEKNRQIVIGGGRQGGEKSALGVSYLMTAESSPPWFGSTWPQ